MQYVLIFALLTGGALRPLPEISGTVFTSYEECESVRTHQAVLASYPGLISWCQAVGEAVK